METGNLTLLLFQRNRLWSRILYSLIGLGDRGDIFALTLCFS